MCAPAPVTPPAGAFELEIEESQWNHVYHAIEYIKQGQRKRKMTDPSDAINSALDDFMEAQYGSDTPCWCIVHNLCYTKVCLR